MAGELIPMGQQRCAWTVLAVTGALAILLVMPARSKTPGEKAPGTNPAKKAAPGHAAARKSTTTTHTAKASKTRKRQSSSRRRLAQLRLEPSRAKEIQQALIQAGYLHEEPTGKWDDQTREAMRRYQIDHGFNATGLPEAKSLMNLGLGPHPLQQDVIPSVTGSASADASGKGAPSTAPNAPH